MASNVEVASHPLARHPTLLLKAVCLLVFFAFLSFRWTTPPPQARSLRSTLEAHQRRSACDVSALKEEVQTLASQLAQRAVLYAAHERRFREEERGREQVNHLASRDAARAEGEAKAMRDEVARLAKQVKEALEDAMVARQQQQAAEAKAREADHRAALAEGELASAQV